MTDNPTAQPFTASMRRCCPTARGAESPHADDCRVRALEARRRGCCDTQVGPRHPHAEACPNRAIIARVAAANKRRIKAIAEGDGVSPDYGRACEVCGARPILPATQMCGPCTFGEAETADGNW